MATRKQRPSRGKKTQPDVPRKMDGVMERLLGMSDARIRQRYNREIKRLEKERPKIEREFKALPPTAGASVIECCREELKCP